MLMKKILTIVSSLSETTSRSCHAMTGMSLRRCVAFMLVLTLTSPQESSFYHTLR